MPSFSDYTDYLNLIINEEYLRACQCKFEMIVCGFGIKGILNYFFPILRDKELLKADILRLLVAREKTETVNKNSLLIHDWLAGYHYDTKVVDSISIMNFSETYNFNNTIIAKRRATYYFNSFIDLCNKNNIKLLCVRAPYPPTRLAISQPDKAGQYFEKLCADLNIPFYDLNYINNSNYTYFDFDFSDKHHMNRFGANKVSEQLAEILKSNIQN